MVRLCHRLTPLTGGQGGRRQFIVGTSLCLPGAGMASFGQWHGITRFLKTISMVLNMLYLRRLSHKTAPNKPWRGHQKCPGRQTFVHCIMPWADVYTIGKLTHKMMWAALKESGPHKHHRAGEGNRTLATCLEGRSSTIELLPQNRYRGDRIRTCDLNIPNVARYQLRYAPTSFRNRSGLTANDTGGILPRFRYLAKGLGGFWAGVDLQGTTVTNPCT